MEIRFRSSGGKGLLFVAVIHLLFAVGASGADILVYNNSDSGPGSLRQAISENNLSGGNTVIFSNIVTGAITLTSGELLITRNVTIKGPGSRFLAVNGNAASRVFHINEVVDAFIFDLTITNGVVSGGYPNNMGGGIWNDHSRLTLSNCVVSGNSGGFGPGGAIYNDGSSTNRRATLRITDCTISGNRAGGGGGIYNYGYQGTASVTIATSTLANNTANGGSLVGGAIWNDGNLGNASLAISTSTLSSNSARQQGGAIYSSSAAGFGTVSLVGSTFSGNSASNHPGGIFVNGANGIAVLTMNNTIFKRGLGANIAINGVQANSFGYNLSDDNGDGILIHATDQINIDPLLGELANNGGPTLTHALLPGSPAIDKGASFGGTKDQRGELRPFEFLSVANASGGDGADIGAFEVGPPRLSIRQDGNSAVLSWPAYSPNFTLFYSTNPTAPFSWTAAAGFPGLNGRDYRQTNGPIPDARFFRLLGN